eukprot:Gb_38535 [translate_table: standard]
MSSISELADILNRIAYHIQDTDKKSCQMHNALQNMGGSRPEGNLWSSQAYMGISVLNQSLKFNQRVPLLNAALSVMGYGVSDICDTTTNFLVNTFISCLLSTISCKILSQASSGANKVNEGDANTSLELFSMTGQRQHQNMIYDGTSYQQPFHTEQIGTLISASEFQKIVEACESIIRHLEEYGNLSTLLMDALLRVATSMSFFKRQFPSSFAIYRKLRTAKSCVLPKLLNLSAKKKKMVEQNFSSHGRLFAWRLQPLHLKEDMSRLLWEAVQRPFLSLKHEFYHGEAWHSIIISLASAPEIFAEARGLLHKWFLQTGAERVLEVHFELVSSMLDVLLRPSHWGISIETGLKLPWSHAFFCKKLHPLLIILMGPLSCDNLLTLVHVLEELHSLDDLRSTTTFKAGVSGYRDSSALGHHIFCVNPSEKSLLLDHNSAWSLLLDFPSWFHFAAMLLFQPETSEYPETEPGQEARDTEMLHSKDGMGRVRSHNSDSFQAAAKYLGWVLSPIEVTHRDLVVRSLVETSKSWNFWRSKFLSSSQEKKKVGEVTGSQHTSLVWEDEIKLNRKRSLFCLESEKGGLGVKYKKAKVGTVQENLNKTDTKFGLEDSDQAVKLWLADFHHSCAKLYADTVNSDSKNKKTFFCSKMDNCEEWGEGQAVLKEGKTDGFLQDASLDAWLKQYSFLKRIPLGLLLANSHLLNEHAFHLLLNFSASDKTLDSSACTHNATDKGSCANYHAGHVVRMYNGSNDNENNVCIKEPAHRTEGFRDEISDCQYEGKAHWMRGAAIILNFFQIIDESYYMFENEKDHSSFMSQVKVKAGKFLVTCIHQFLENQDLQDTTMLKDLRCRFVELSQQGELKLDESNIYRDILLALDTRISSPQVTW